MIGKGPGARSGSRRAQRFKFARSGLTNRANDNPARWGSADGADQSNSSARMRCCDNTIHEEH